MALQLGPIRRTIDTTFSSLHTRNFRLYFTGQIISNTGNWLTNVALTLLVLHLTQSGLAVGLLAACQYGPILLLSAYGGVIADRYDKRRMLLLTQTLEMAESIGLAIAAFMPHTSLTALFLLAIAGGVFLAFDNPLRRSFVSEMVPGDQVANAVVLYSTIVNVSKVIGPALAGALVITAGYGWSFTVDAATYLAVITCLLLMRSGDLYKAERRPKQKGEIRQGLQYIRAVPSLRISFTMLAIIGVLAYNFSVTMPLFVEKGLHLTTAAYTILYSIMSVGSVIGALVIAHRRAVHLRHVILGAATLGIAMFLLAIAPSMILAIPAALLIGGASILYSTSTTALAQLESEAHIRGRVLAVQTVLLIGTTPLGGPLLGWIADGYGGRLPLIIGCVASLGAAAFGYLAAQRQGERQGARVAEHTDVA